jgi:hypothetical protein
VSETLNTYDSYKESFITNLGKVQFFNQADSPCSSCTSGMTNGFSPYPNNCQYPQLFYFTGNNKTGQKKLSQSIERSYSGNSYVETVQNIQYDNYLQQSNITTLSSKGETLKSTFTYPYNYTVSPYTNMTAFNYIAPVIEETNFLNNVQTFKKITDYQGVRPSKIRTKIGNGTEITPITFNTYDARENLRLYTLRSGQTTLLTWYGTTDGGKTDLLKSQTVGGGSTGSAL